MPEQYKTKLHLSYSSESPCQELNSLKSCFENFFRELTKFFPSKDPQMQQRHGIFSGNPRDGYNALYHFDISLGDISMQLRCSYVYILGYYTGNRRISDAELACFVQNISVQIEPSCNDFSLGLCLPLLEKPLQELGFLFSGYPYMAPELEGRYLNFKIHLKRSYRERLLRLAKQERDSYDFSYTSLREIEEYLALIPKKELVKRLSLRNSNLKYVSNELACFPNLKLLELSGNPLKQSEQEIVDYLPSGIRLFL